MNVEYWLTDSEEKDFKLRDIPSPTDMAKAIERVRELHSARHVELQNEFDDGFELVSFCNDCGDEHPCDTIKALDGTNV